MISSYLFDPAETDLEILSKFKLDAENGTLYAKVNFDREEKPFYQIKIVAKDHGKPSLSTSTVVFVEITDEVFSASGS